VQYRWFPIPAITHAPKALASAYALAVLLLLAGCHGEAPVTTARFNAFGTLVDLSLVRVDKHQSDQAATLIAQDFEQLERDWSPLPPSPLGRVNELLPKGEPFVAPPAILHLVRLSQDLSERSSGLFNPAIGRLMDLWGFQGGPPECHPPPSAQAIARLVASDPRMSDIRLAGLELQGTNGALKLDFDAIAKGAAVDIAIERLHDLGIRDAQVQVGGVLRAIGDRSGQPWRVPIRRASGSGVLAVLTIRGDESVATAASYERNFIYGGTTYHDILDPRTGWPATGAQSVTVLHRDAATAEAAATALLVAGPEAWVGVARALGIRYALLADSRGAVHLSPELHARIELVDSKRDLILSESLDPPSAPDAEP
jgi:thiamine biosynthesis lipoprotein